jgi:hypothetical protein
VSNESIQSDNCHKGNVSNPFENMTKLKCLGTTVTNQNHIMKKSGANKVERGLVTIQFKLFPPSCLLSKNVKNFACWFHLDMKLPLIKMEEYGLRMFKNKLLKRIFELRERN